MARSQDLSEHRDEIAEIDRALLELIRRRFEVAAHIGRHKAEQSLPVVVRDVEDRVLSKARDRAEDCGVSESVMAEIFQAIIRGSVERQYRIGIERRAGSGGQVLVLGGAGGMGSWIRHFLELIGHQVHIVDPALRNLPAAPDQYASLADVEEINRFDAIVVAVPLRQTPDVLTRVVERRPKGPVIEVASIKDHLRPALELARNSGVTVRCLHPMFGPGKSHYEPLTFVVASQNEPEEERAALEALLRHPYSRFLAVPFAHHDRLMGWLLGLAHLNGMLFGAALTRSGLDPRELSACASTTFSRQAGTALSVLSEDPDLYLDIQHLNPHRDAVYAATKEALDHLIDVVSKEDREDFRETMRAARSAVQPED
ncbi:MAG: prephenate dehydrogenase/arogenate dehydrogenase family protein [Planctomycetota bacterium]